MKEVVAASSSSSAVSEFAVPLRPTSSLRRRPQKVLEEDEYVASISHIIEKDFFPDLAEIRAVDSDSSSAPEAGGSKEGSLPPGGLDAFLASHTGEDNESFHEIMEKASKEEALKKEWLYLQPQKDEKESSALALEALRVPSITEQASKEGQSKPLLGWKYKANNSVFYPVEGVPLSQEEEIQKAKKDRIVLHENTRFAINPWRESDTSAAAAAAKRRGSLAAGKVGADGKELNRPGETPSLNGYKFMRMDSPAVDPSESPLMTWGKIDSTPLRIQDSGSSTPYTQFKIQKMPERDVIALELTEKNAKFYRDKKQKAIQKACRNMKSPSASLRIASMSPAAQRLATSKLGVRLGTDKSSRTPTPSPRAKNPSTPLKNVISNSIRSKSKDLTDGLLQISSSSTTTPSRVDNSSSDSLTDNLLNLSNKLRSKASDFF